jgi:hypothetical protein
MVILLSILGLILGLYVVVLVRGHLATKKVLTSLTKTGSPPEGRKDGHHQSQDDDNSG